MAIGPSFFSFLDLLATVARPAAAARVPWWPKSVLVKQQLEIRDRSRKRSPNLRLFDRVVAGVCARLIRPARLSRSADRPKPSTLFSLRTPAK